MVHVTIKKSTDGKQKGNGGVLSSFLNSVIRKNGNINAGQLKLFDNICLLQMSCLPVIFYIFPNINIHHETEKGPYHARFGVVTEYTTLTMDKLQVFIRQATAGGEV